MMKKKITLLAMVLTMVASLFAGCGKDSGSGSSKKQTDYEKAVGKFMDSMADRDSDKMISLLLPEDVYQGLADIYTATGTEYTSDDIKEMFASIISLDDIPDDFAYTIGDSTKMSEDDIEDLEGDLYFEDLELEIDEAYEVEVTATYTQDDEKQKEEESVYAYKYDGSWYVFIDA